jgi:heptaprenyl diphosphate synthase
MRSPTNVSEKVSQSGPAQDPAALALRDRASIVAFLGAFCLFLSLVEYAIPKPLPFMRLGLANLPVVIGAAFLDFPALIALALVKALGMGIVSGALFSYVMLFSLAGGLSAAAVVWALLRLPRRLVSSIGASVAAALVSNAVQLVLARFLIFHEAALLTAPPFLAMGLVTGFFLGVFAERFREKSLWLAEIGATGVRVATEGVRFATEGVRFATEGVRFATEGARVATESARTATTYERARVLSERARDPAARSSWMRIVSPSVSALIGLGLSLVFLCIDSLPIRAVLLVFFVAAAGLAGRRVSFLAAFLTMIGIVAANLLAPVGRVLVELGPLVITETALREGLEKALVFEGLLYASKAFIRPGLELPGRFGSILALSFATYDRIVERGPRLGLSSLIEDVDRLVCEVWEDRPGRISS